MLETEYFKGSICRKFEMMSEVIWFIKNSDGSRNISAILDLLLPEFARIFGTSTMIAEKCVIYNDPIADCPMLVTNSSPISIRLAQPSLDYWAQTIFQLSHELCHYALRQHKIDKNITLKWFEEIVCEAMALYSLKYAADNWSRCLLFNCDPTFSDKIADYLRGQLEKNGNEDFSQCKTLEMLASYEEIKCNDRDSHRNESKTFYGIISRNPTECRCICGYTEYIGNQNKVTIDFKKWKEDYPYRIIDELQKLQPVEIV